MRNACVLGLVLFAAACDPAATSQHAEVAHAGSDYSYGSNESSSSSEASEHHDVPSGGIATLHADPPRASPAEAAHVKIVQAGATLDEPTEVIGVVDVHESGRTEAQGLEIMKERAAAMHADAVVEVEFHRDDKDFVDLSGLAVRFRDLLRNRSYDKIQEIRVHEGEGKDGDAMGELRRRAVALNADLIIDVAWHDNDAEKDGTYLSGTAIRFR